MALLEMQFKGRCYLHFFKFQEKYALSNHSNHLTISYIKQQMADIFIDPLFVTIVNQSINHIFQDYFIVCYYQITVGRLSK